MRPPECARCQERFTPNTGGALVYFERSTADLEWQERCESEGIVAHPPFADWFCNKHLPRAQELVAFPLEEALRNWLGAT